jgi:hypothetical protein
MIAADYNRQPSKPVLDGEPCYEDHPIDPFRRKWQADYGRFNDHDVRKQAYRALFAGACGHTYGHHAMWQFWTLQRQPVNFPMPTWDEAILRPGAAQLIHLKNLMLSRPYFSRIPDPAMLPDLPAIPTENTQERHHPLRAAQPQATRCADGRYGMVYFPQAGQSLQVDLSSLAGRLNAWWYDPRTGQAHPIGEQANEPTTFTSPIGGPDWVLVLDDVHEGFAAPGSLS